MEKHNPFYDIYRSKEYREVNNLPLRKFPFIVDVEPTNWCNLNCLFCAQRIMTRPRGFMSMEIFKKIVDECAQYNTPIRLIRWGEPLLHEQLFDFIAYAKQKNIYVHLTTNGLLLDRDKIMTLFKLRLDSIIFSMQGATEEEYKLMRNNNKYRDLENNIKLMLKLREEYQFNRPWIHISTTITNEMQEEVNAFKNKWMGLVDSVGIGKTNLERVALRENLARIKPYLNKQTIKKEYRPCTEVRQKLSINWNGDVTACCSDYDGTLVLGNIKDKSLEEFWHSTKLDKIRYILDNNGFKELEPCNLCYHTYDSF
ncbi:coenzyme PQQ synthesis protein E [Moorella thermoacetica]|uniref:Coenzyme PQQ synthesis protein E n=1 Tax=Neomoorella thermoacetica TaxID=1525 RepID=A0A1J5JWP4_NEOTH|nr:radical SAM protein [Moorella thermoacetica]OIQ09840.1 coenzyme PQQ synthesis protein E [Moorella thermoacetica]